MSISLCLCLPAALVKTEEKLFSCLSIPDNATFYGDFKCNKKTNRIGKEIFHYGSNFQFISYFVSIAFSANLYFVIVIIGNAVSIVAFIILHYVNKRNIEK